MKKNILTKCVGAALLIAGCSIGIGMLAMPVTTGLSGFYPSIILLAIAAFFMGNTAFLLVEVDLNNQSQSNLLSLAEHTLGKWARALVWINYLFLFYCLMTAYITKGGEIFALICPIPYPSLLLTLAVILILYCSRPLIDLLNRGFMVALLISFVTILSLGLASFDPTHLQHSDWGRALPVVPFIVTAYGFHNIIPTVSDYLGRSRKHILASITLGCLLIFVLYFLWMVVVVGSGPLDGALSLRTAYENEWTGTEFLFKISNQPLIQASSLYLAFFAILTSMLAQGLGLIDFLFDGFGLTRTTRNKSLLIVLIFLPTYIAAQCIPGLFFLALELAGGIAAVFLFGLLPVLMAWKVRGRLSPLLALIGLTSCLILFYEIFRI